MKWPITTSFHKTYSVYRVSNDWYYVRDISGKKGGSMSRERDWMIENTKRKWLQKRDDVIDQEYYNTLAKSEDKTYALAFHVW